MSVKPYDARERGSGTMGDDEGGGEGDGMGSGVWALCLMLPVITYISPEPKSQNRYSAPRVCSIHYIMHGDSSNIHWHGVCQHTKASLAI